MVAQREHMKKILTGGRLLVRGEALIALVGFALAVVITSGIVIGGWWALRSQRDSLDIARREQVRSVSSMLAQSAASMLGSGDLSSLRRSGIDSKSQYT